MMRNKKIGIIIISLIISIMIVYGSIQIYINNKVEKIPVTVDSTVYGGIIEETIKEQPYSKELLKENNWFIDKVRLYKYTYNLIKEGDYRNDWDDVEIIEYYGYIRRDVYVEAKKAGIPVSTDIEDPPLSSDLQEISNLLYFNDFNNLKELTVQYTAITDLKGIEEFENLEYVDVRNNAQLTTINYVENLPNLETLCVSIDTIEYITQESYDYLLENNIDIYSGTFKDDNGLFDYESDSYIATSVDKFVEDNDIEII